MHLLILSSDPPNFGHFRASETVCAALIEELLNLGHRVSLAFAGRGRPLDAPSMARLSEHGLARVLDLTGRIAVPVAAPLRRAATKLRRLVGSAIDVDAPRFADPATVARELQAVGADVALLFWDTVFEKLLPFLDRPPVVGYLGKPPHAQAELAIEAIGSPWRRALERRELAMRARRHFRRLRRLRQAAEICDLDRRLYAEQGVPCRYISNMWPDVFGPDWRARRVAAEAARTGLHLLGNIGGLNATGNRQGLDWLARAVLPLLRPRLEGLEWRVNICGRFALPDDLRQALDDPRVALRGFVPDIDDEVAGNHLFLLFNNAGPYTGGYTRVAYAMSSGACLVAHRRLAESMPELVAGTNCLLAADATEAADLIAVAARDPALRSRIGAAARQTYERHYAPALVAARIAAMAEAAR